MKTDWTTAQKKGIEFLALEFGVSRTAKDCGVSINAVKKWLKKPDYLAAVNDRKKELGKPITASMASPDRKVFSPLNPINAKTTNIKTKTAPIQDTIPEVPAQNLATHASPADSLLTATKIEDLEGLAVKYMELVLRTSIDAGRPNPTAFKVAIEALRRAGKVGPKPVEQKEQVDDEFIFGAVDTMPHLKAVPATIHDIGPAMDARDQEKMLLDGLSELEEGLG